MKFDWDVPKAAGNVRKHGVSFEEASAVFYDPFAITVPDELHSQAEERQLTIGTSPKMRVLLVVSTQREEDLIWIISARRATAGEVSDYEEEIKKRTRGG